MLTYYWIESPLVNVNIEMALPILPVFLPTYWRDWSSFSLLVQLFSWQSPAAHRWTKKLTQAAVQLPQVLGFLLQPNSWTAHCVLLSESHLSWSLPSSCSSAAVTTFRHVFTQTPSVSTPLQLYSSAQVLCRQPHQQWLWDHPTTFWKAWWGSDNT